MKYKEKQMPGYGYIAIISLFLLSIGAYFLSNNLYFLFITLILILMIVICFSFCEFTASIGKPYLSVFLVFTSTKTSSLSSNAMISISPKYELKFLV